METTAVAKKTDEIEDLWVRFHQTKSEQIREKLVLQYIPLVKYVVGRMFSHLPSHVSREEIISAGALGLIAAVGRYEPDRQVKFETYAIPRIRGAIIDELRSYDMLPRSARLKMKKLQRAIQNLENKYKRSPTDDEIASNLGMSIESYYDLLKELSPIRFFSLTDLLNSDGEWRIHKEALSHWIELENPEKPTETQEMRSALLSAIQSLLRNERLLIALYYYEDMTMKEIGVVLKVSESRVSQIHTQALLKLRNNVEKAMK